MNLQFSPSQTRLRGITFRAHKLLQNKTTEIISSLFLSSIIFMYLWLKSLPRK